jgi:hypothetical protein
MAADTPGSKPPAEESQAERPDYLTVGNKEINANNLTVLLQAYVSKGRKVLIQLERCLHYTQQSLNSKKQCAMNGPNYREAKKRIEEFAAAQNVLTPINACKRLKSPEGSWQEQSSVYSIEQVAATGEIDDHPIDNVLEETGSAIRNSVTKSLIEPVQMELPIESAVNKRNVFGQWIDAQQQIYSLCAQIAPVIEQYEILLRHVRSADPEGITAIPEYKEMEADLEASGARLLTISDLLAEVATEIMGKEAA